MHIGSYKIFNSLRWLNVFLRSKSKFSIFGKPGTVIFSSTGAQLFFHRKGIPTMQASIWKFHFTRNWIYSDSKIAPEQKRFELGLAHCFRISCWADSSINSAFDSIKIFFPFRKSSNKKWYFPSKKSFSSNELFNFHDNAFDIKYQMINCHKNCCICARQSWYTVIYMNFDNSTAVGIYLWAESVWNIWLWGIFRRFD